MIENNNRSIYPWIVTILISAWFIAMAIFGAGYLISKEIANSGNSSNILSDSEGSLGSSQGPSEPVDISVTEQMYQLGSSGAPVTIIEFADFQCPFCGLFQQEAFSLIKQNYIDTGKVRFAYSDFPFLGEESFRVAEAARCAAEQDGFWKYHDALYEAQSGENEGAFSDEKLIKLSGDLGLNQTQFNGCLKEDKYKDQVLESVQFAEKYGVNSTPTFFINGIKLEGALPYVDFEQIIESELAKQQL